MSDYFMGIDVSKGYADFVILDSKKRVVEPTFQLDDNFDGHNKLFDFLNQFSLTHPDAAVFAAVESTGSYENNWFSALRKFQKDLNIQVARLNPKGVNHNSKASLKRVITDSVSAVNIAEYLIDHPEKVSYQTEDYFSTLRSQWTYVKMLTKQKTQLLNQLEKMLYKAHPELLIYCRGYTPQWLLKLLQRHPTAKKVAQTSVDTIAEIPYVSKKLAVELVDKAKASVASADDVNIENIIKSMAEEILHKEELIKKQVQQMAENCRLPEINLLKSFKSISDFSAIGIILEIGAVERFPSTKKIASFFGLHPKFKESGDGTWGIRMSKEGRSEMRAILFMVAMVAINHNPVIREIYKNNLRKGKCKMAAIGICMHKILRILYGMLKHNTPFDPEIDRRNREKVNTYQKTQKSNKKHRLQDPGLDAPISRRQNKKRKEQEQSQSDNITINEISVPALSRST